MSYSALGFGLTGLGFVDNLMCVFVKGYLGGCSNSDSISSATNVLRLSVAD